MAKKLPMAPKGKKVTKKRPLGPKAITKPGGGAGGGLAKKGLY